MPAPTAIKLGPSVWRQPDGAITRGASPHSAPAKHADVEPLTGLKPGHPLEGKLVLDTGLSGWPNSTVDDDSNIVPVDAAGDIIPPEVP